MGNMEEIHRAIENHRYRYANEAELQDAIARVLDDACFQFRREVRLSDRDRIDFLVDGIGIEVKIKGSGSALVRQVYRYLQHEELQALIVVTTRVRHSLPSEIRGKPVGVVHLWRQGL